MQIGRRESQGGPKKDAESLVVTVTLIIARTFKVVIEYHHRNCYLYLSISHEASHCIFFLTDTGLSVLDNFLGFIIFFQGRNITFKN